VRIGILAGMGAAAGVYFYDTIVKECQKMGCRRDGDFPEIIIYNMSSYGISETGEIDESVLKNDVLNGICLLTRNSVSSILLACNTAHVYFDYFYEKSGGILVNMPKCAIDSCGGDSFGVLCSRTARSVYSGGLFVTDREQGYVNEAIEHAISGEISELDEERMYAVAVSLRLRDNPVKKVILGCTEIPLVLRRKEPWIVDAGLVAIQEVLKDWV
jgi:aspartate/glutamate racemase